MKRFYGAGSGLTMYAVLVGSTAPGAGCGGGNPSTTMISEDGGPDAAMPGDGGSGDDGSNADAGADGSQPAQGDASVDGGSTDAAGEGAAPDGSTNGAYTVGGNVSGLTGTGLVLQDNAGDNLTISANGAFTFPTPMSDGSTYAVTVLTPPGAPSQTCTVNGGTGTIAGGNVTNVPVACMTKSYAVGGTVSGLTGTIVLLDNGGDA